MANLCLQIGQCGNQIGQAFFDALVQDFSTLSDLSRFRLANAFFHEPPKGEKWAANAVLIDTEPKVVTRCLASKQEVYSFRRSLSHMG